MPLTPGLRLGAYEIVSTLGVGGMGEVYRARDTILNRDVALKVLPDLFALDGDRLARFKREAQVLAALNHPHIAAIYGFEQIDGVQALVLELVDGPTLADRIAHGSIPLDEALPVARQIAEALSAAHEQGIVHRDLKPSNIKVRLDGVVKVLDFGLAKLVEGPANVGAGFPGLSRVEGSRPDASASPTITSPVMTGIGVLLGTAAYMAPEQAKGRPADKRSDVWAFGCVLYEILTGRARVWWRGRLRHAGDRAQRRTGLGAAPGRCAAATSHANQALSGKRPATTHCGSLDGALRHRRGVECRSGCPRTERS